MDLVPYPAGMSPVAGRWFALWMCLLAFAGRLVVDIWVRPFAMGIEPTVPSLLITVAAVVINIGVPLVLYVAAASPLPYPAVLEVDAARAAFVAPAGDAWHLQAILLSWLGAGIGPTLAEGPVDAGFWSSTAIVAVTGAAVAFLLFGNRPRLVLEPAGLTVQYMVLRRKVWWSELLPGGPPPPASQGFSAKIKLLLRPPDPHTAPARVNVPVGQLAVSPEFLAATIRHYAEQPERRPAIGTGDELARLRSELAGAR